MKSNIRAQKTKRLNVTIAKDLADVYSQMAERARISLSRLVERALFSFVQDSLYAPKRRSRYEDEDQRRAGS